MSGTSYDLSQIKTDATGYAGAFRTLIGAGTSSFDGSYGSLSGKPVIPAAIATGTITPRDDDIDLSGGSLGDVITVQADGSLALSAVPVPDVSGLVPYTGATSELNLGSQTLALGSYRWHNTPNINITKEVSSTSSAFRITTEENSNFTHSGSSIVIGSPSSSTGLFSSSIGNATKASGIGCTAVGAVAEATFIYCTAIGFQAYATSTGCTAIGYGTTASSTNCTAIGYNAIADGSYGVGHTAIGGQTITMPSAVEKYKTSTVNPTTTDIKDGERRCWYNSVLGEFRDWANIGGVLYKSEPYA